MRRLAAAVVAVLALAVVAGCGSASHAAVPPSPARLAAQMGGTGYAPDVPPTLFAREEGTCQIGPADLDIVTFSTPDTQANWMKAASQFGGVFVQGDLWTVSTDASTATLVQGALGGTIR